ncbi:hypothetical protein [Salisaeta longa]|uniref:hypothetical protein n=1 Tax=Salisaeta longa TaxID=503170 RepID=UPI001E5B4617|nr:hypothetical protein [Salisaeta longa]
MYIWLLLMGLLGGHAAAAQDTTRVFGDLAAHRDTIDAFRPQPFALRPWILPGSARIYLNGARLDTSAYRLHTQRGRLWVVRPRRLGLADTLVAVYRTYPFPLAQRYRRGPRDTTATARRGAPNATRADAPADPFAGLAIQSSGSITRGVVAGTNRDANLASGLRMQLQGNVTKDVSVRAVLTDANTPLQPAGTTQRLRDFDRVFMEVNAPPGTMQLGDIDARFSTSRFAQFARRLQGAKVESQAVGPAVGLAEGSATVVGAVSRGQFRTQTVDLRDGVQGPYRLRGANGERFIIVVAGSETVYLDGERLTRGRTNDYTIDYAAAELTFTANRLITDDRRLTVTFQYRTSAFDRTLVGAQTQAAFWTTAQGAPRVRLGATVLREADGQNFGAAFDLSAADSTRLRQAGDAQAFRQTAEQVPFDPEAPYIQYARRVTAAGDTIFSVLETAPPPGAPVYRVDFTFVGAGNGAYVPGTRAANGLAYTYEGPGEGRYAPVAPIPAPQEQRIVDLHGTLTPVRGVTLVGEWAQSYNDLNRFSARDAANDRAQAYRAGLRLDSLNVGWGRLGATFSRERRGASFVTFEPTRAIEFNRRWNLDRSGTALPDALRAAGDEVLTEAQVRWQPAAVVSVESGWGQFQIGDAFTARRQTGALRAGHSGPTLGYRVSRVASTNRATDRSGTWLKQHGTLRYPLGDAQLTPRLAISHERRMQRTLSGRLTDGSFVFVEVQPGVGLTAGAWRVTGSVAYRQTDEAAADTLRAASTSWTVQSGVAFDPAGALRTRAQVGYRSRRIRDYFRINRGRAGTESLLLQLEATAAPLDRGLEWSFFYEGRTERTPTQQEVYLRTGPDLGQYVWTDLNGDGLQQTDEFIPETTPNEGEYVQSFIPSDELTPVVSVDARTTLRWEPRRWWDTATAWWKQGLSHLSTRTVVEVAEENAQADIASIYLLNLSRFRTPGATLSGRLRLQQTAALFRDEVAYGVEGTFSQVRTLRDRAANTQRSFLNSWSVEGYWRFADAWTARLRGVWALDRQRSSAFDSRSFAIQTRQAEPTLTYRPHPSVALTAQGILAQKTDRLGNRSAQLVRVPLVVEWARAGAFRWTARAEVSNVRLTGAARGLAQFELTDGRGPGTSYLWRVQGQLSLSQTLSATIAYDGRAPSNAPTIHTARVQLTASF